MTVGSPSKRRMALARATSEQPMRLTRSKSRIASAPLSPPHHSSSSHHQLEASDGLEDTETDPRKQALRNSFSEKSDDGQAEIEIKQPSHRDSAQRPFQSPRKHLASHEIPLFEFGSDSPETAPLQPKMESPRKGRFNDFEFELEKSLSEITTRRTTTAAAPAASSKTSLSFLSRASRDRSSVAETHAAEARNKVASIDRSTAQQGLPRSRTLLSSGKLYLGSGAAETLSAKAISSSKSTKPLTVPNPFKLNARPKAAVSSDALTVSTEASSKRMHTSMSPSVSNESIRAIGNRRTAEPGAAARSHIYKSTRTTSSVALDKALENPFRQRGEGDEMTPSTIKASKYLGNHSSVLDRSSNPASNFSDLKKSPPKAAPLSEDSDYVIRSPSRKPINLHTLKPSPGKAKRGMFRHEDVDGDDDDADDKPGDPTERHGFKPEPNSAFNHDAIVGATERGIPRTQPLPAAPSTTSDKIALSSETSDALASLEATLASLTARPSRRVSSSKFGKPDESNSSPPKRTLTDHRPKALSPSKYQNTANGESLSRLTPSTIASHSNSNSDLGLGRCDAFLPKPANRMSFVSKSRGLVLGQLRRKSEMFDDTKFKGEHHLSTKTESLSVKDVTDTSVFDTEAKRKSEIKANRRRSMHSIVSFGGSLSAAGSIKKENDGLIDAPFIEPVGESTSDSVAKDGGESTAAASEALAKKAAKAARRRSLYAYVPTKREDPEVLDRSSGLVIGSSQPSVADSDNSVPSVSKKERAAARFLRGLTVLVDVRDQDGEDASACWVEMLKNAGAKVLVRFGERQLTHIVYKSGRPSTLHTYRSLPEPKPLVVGISWVVKCLEEGKRVDEKPYIVEVGKEAIFNHRRRSSMAPKQAPSLGTSPPRELLVQQLSDPRPQQATPEQAAPTLLSPERLTPELQRKVRVAKMKALEHAPAVPSPLRLKCYSANIYPLSKERLSYVDAVETTRPVSNPFSLASDDNDELLARYGQRANHVVGRDALITA